MLCAGVIHGDLSEFNILVGADGPVIIDLPQAVDAAGNNNAAVMLQRDADNLTTYFSRFAPALALLFLMVPPPMPVMDRINPFLVQASGRTAVALLTPFDPEVGWSAATLSFRGWTLIVAEACSGSGTFLMLGTLCVFLAALFRLRVLPALGLLALALPLTLLVNGVRIASSALIIDRFGAAAGEGLPHEILGQVVVLAGVGLLVLAVERWAARRTPVRA